MKDIEIVLENLALKGIKPDQSQQLFLETFMECDSKYKRRSLFRKNLSPGSIYLWGPVGRGKTLLLKAIHDCYFRDSGIFHFLEFMELIHGQLAKIKKNKDPLLIVTKNISKKYKIIFIDEFQIEDISDAMIVGLVIESLIDKGVRIMLSSNAYPDELYKNGLQRNKFLPTIKLIQSHFTIFNLQGTQDYRLKAISLLNDCEKDADIQMLLLKIFDEEWGAYSDFKVNNRVFSCKGHSKSFLWLSFKDFFSEPCSSKDFIEICQTYEWIFISEFHSCNDEYLDKIRRLISFIDIAYQERQQMKLFTNISVLQNLYTGTQLEFLWERTVSRLYEISSKKYLEDFKKK
ncbi:cell division protein ZapE [Gammaproteobacteria bacterium]|nr:cell division protein ZapE [Gammaproteobacteria bacterium]